MLNCDEFLCQLITPVALPVFVCSFLNLVDFKDFFSLPFLIQVDFKSVLRNECISLMSLTVWFSLLLQTCQADEISLNF